MQGDHSDHIRPPLQASLQRLFQPVWEFNQQLNLLNLDAIQEIQRVGSRMAALQHSNAVSHADSRILVRDSDGEAGLNEAYFVTAFDYFTVGYRLRNRLLMLTNALQQHILHFRV